MRPNHSSPLSVQLLVEAVDQHRDTIKAQALALVMKIKVGVVDAGVAHNLESPLIGLFDRLFVARLVD